MPSIPAALFSLARLIASITSVYSIGLLRQVAVWSLSEELTSRYCSWVLTCNKNSSSKSLELELNSDLNSLHHLFNT